MAHLVRVPRGCRPSLPHRHVTRGHPLAWAHMLGLETVWGRARAGLQADCPVCPRHASPGVHTPSTRSPDSGEEEACTVHAPKPEPSLREGKVPGDPTALQGTPDPQAGQEGSQEETWGGMWALMPLVSRAPLWNNASARGMLGTQGGREPFTTGPHRLRGGCSTTPEPALSTGPLRPLLAPGWMQTPPGGGTEAH